MANQRGIVAGWDATNSRPKGVTSAADMRASLQMIATHPGIMTEPGAATITLPSNAMRVNWTAFTAVIRSTLGGWYTPRIEAGGIALSIGNATYARIDVVWVRQRDYQVNASWPDSEVEIGVAQGTASATPSTPAVPTGALAIFMVRVPAGATTGSAIGLANVTASARTAPAGGIITAASQAEMDALAAAAGADKCLYVWRSDTQALMRHDGTAWEWVTPRDTGWVDVPCVASNSAVQARRVGDRVSLRGDLYNTSNAPISGSSITGVLGTLPALFRAPKSQWTLCNSWVAGLPSTSPAYGRPMGLIVYQTGELLLQNPQSQAITCAELWGVNLWTN